MLKVPSKSPHILISKVAILLVWFCLFNVCYAQSDDASSVQLQVRVFLEGLIESRTPEMVRVEAGQFIIGIPADQSNLRLWNAGDEIDGNFETPQKSVTILHPFEVSRHEITRAQFKYFLDNNPSIADAADERWDNPAYFEQNAMHPAIFVSWNDAKAYVAWLSELTGQTYRLLSEAEWEYVARAGTTSPYHFGDMISARQAHYDKENTARVGSYPENQFGLHDVHGNVWEWVEDCWHANYDNAPSDGSAWSTGCSITANRVIRGGSWVSYLDSSFLRSAGRTHKLFTRRNFNYLGFRIARTLD